MLSEIIADRYFQLPSRSSMPTLPKKALFCDNIIRISAYDYRIHEYRLYTRYVDRIVLVYIVLYICLIYFATFVTFGRVRPRLRHDAKPIHAERLAGLDMA